MAGFSQGPQLFWGKRIWSRVFYPLELSLNCQVERGSWGEMDTCSHMAESLHCSPVTISTLLISYNPNKIKSFKKLSFKYKGNMQNLREKNTYKPFVFVELLNLPNKCLWGYLVKTLTSRGGIWLSTMVAISHIWLLSTENVTVP